MLYSLPKAKTKIKPPKIQPAIAESNFTNITTENGSVGEVKNDNLEEEKSASTSKTLSTTSSIGDVFGLNDNDLGNIFFYSALSISRSKSRVYLTLCI